MKTQLLMALVAVVTLACADATGSSRSAVTYAARAESRVDSSDVVFVVVAKNASTRSIEIEGGPCSVGYRLMDGSGATRAELDPRGAVCGLLPSFGGTIAPGDSVVFRSWPQERSNLPTAGEYRVTALIETTAGFASIPAGLLVLR